jgi:ferredoxin-NADP reductase
VATQYEVTITGSTRCDETLTLRFERPDVYVFEPGQYFMLGVDTEAGEETKPFSHASAPADPYIEMTTRVSGSTFKAALAAAAPGRTRVRLRGPAGRFGLEVGDAQAPVFLAGGVGITPVMSILRQADREGRELNASLIYGNAVGRCIPYIDEIESMSPSLVTTSLVIEKPEPSWTGPAGFITADTVRESVPDTASHLYYVTGPPAMVDAMSSVLDDLEVREDSRRVEKFGR